jgi:hypothetical protein
LGDEVAIQLRNMSDILQDEGYSIGLAESDGSDAYAGKDFAVCNANIII